MHIAMQQGMYTMILAVWLYAITVSLMRVRNIILERECKAQWVSELPEIRR